MDDVNDDDDELSAPLLARLLAWPRPVMSPAERAAEEERVLGVLRAALVAHHNDDGAATYDPVGIRFGRLLGWHYLRLLSLPAEEEEEGGRTDPVGDLATIAFCLRCLHELHEPWRSRFAATVDLDAAVDALLVDADPEAYVDTLVDTCLRAFDEGAEPRVGFCRRVNLMQGRTRAHTDLVRNKLAQLCQATTRHVNEIAELRALDLPAAVDEIGSSVFNPEWLGEEPPQLPLADWMRLHVAITRWFMRRDESYDELLERLDALAARAGDYEDGVDGESRFQLSALALLARDLALHLREARFPDRALAVGLGTHSRAGDASWLRRLDPGLVRGIAEMALLT